MASFPAVIVGIGLVPVDRLYIRGGDPSPGGGVAGDVGYAFEPHAGEHGGPMAPTLRGAPTPESLGVPTSAGGSGAPVWV